MSDREQVIFKIAQRILAVHSSNQITKVAVDGVDGAGKSVFADELCQILQHLGEVVIHASVDSFHNFKAIRYRLGSSSPQGFFLDSYNYNILKEVLLEPLSFGGNRLYRKVVFDCKTDSSVNTPLEVAELGSILVFDGIFLHRPEIRTYWDYSIFLDVDFRISVPRGNQRFGGSPDPNCESNRRYVEGQKIYLSQCKPREQASIIINNEEFDSPYIVV